VTPRELLDSFNAWKMVFSAYLFEMCQQLEMTSLDLGKAAPALPEGFRQERDLFSVVDEKSFCQHFEALPFKPFEFHGYLGNRRIVSFGYRYDYVGRSLRKAEPMPDFL
jgi:hypothetical protein